MPFTLSHPAAALPVWPLVRRGYLPLAPFVAGAMAPDFEYLLRLEPYALVSHTARGIVVFALPVGVVLLFAWRILIEPFARALFALPPRADGVASLPPGWWWQGVALVTGSVSHVTWDAFTHRDAWGPVLFPSLRAAAFTIAGTTIPWYNVLQAASSLAGGVIVLGWLWREVQRGGQGVSALVAPWRMRRWIALGAAMLVVAAWNAPRRGLMADPSRAKLVYGRAAVGGLMGLAAGFLALSVVHRSRRQGMMSAYGRGQDA